MAVYLGEVGGVKWNLYQKSVYGWFYNSRQDELNESNGYGLIANGDRIVIEILEFPKNTRPSSAPKRFDLADKIWVL